MLNIILGRVMKKEDYMKLSKERLAELLEERDNEPRLIPASAPPVVLQGHHPLCYEPGGTCMNPQMDCINCPRHGNGYGLTIGTSTC